MSAAALTAIFKVWGKLKMVFVCLLLRSIKKNSPQQSLGGLMFGIYLGACMLMIHHCAHDEQGYYPYQIQVSVYTAFEDIGAVENCSDE